jgi:hypothetical protein
MQIANCKLQIQLPGFATLALALLAIGCGGSSNAVHVQGKVSLRGEPLPRGVVTFFPASGRPVSAPISSQGEYSAKLSPGEYTAIVNVGVPLPPGYKEGDPLPKPEFDLPTEYTSAARSKLTATVSAQGQKPIDFNLE